jgi:hypothetical protein
VPKRFITGYVKEKLQKLQRGSIRGFIAETKRWSHSTCSIRRTSTMENPADPTPLQHKNGFVDDKFRRHFLETNDEYRMTLDEFLKCFECLAEAVAAVDEEARKVLKLALFS